MFPQINQLPYIGLRDLVLWGRNRFQLVFHGRCYINVQSRLRWLKFNSSKQIIRCGSGSITTGFIHTRRKIIRRILGYIKRWWSWLAPYKCFPQPQQALTFNHCQDGWWRFRTQLFSRQFALRRQCPFTMLLVSVCRETREEQKRMRSGTYEYYQCVEELKMLIRFNRRADILDKIDAKDMRSKSLHGQERMEELMR